MKKTYVQLKSITEIGVDTTYDITVKDKHRLIARHSSQKENLGFYTSNCWHPDVESFIKAKLQPGQYTKFNLSVLITEEFMDAVKNSKSWNLEFPDTSYHKYDAEWDGNLREWKNKGYPVIVYKTFEDANELWNVIMQSTYTRNEPGVIFIDRYNELNNLYYCERIIATNPCGEQGLSKGNSCNLGSINLTQFINADRTDFDYDKLSMYLSIMLRFQDNINDVTNFPLKHQKDEALSKRRVGIGYMGYGSALYMMKKEYGSEEALELTDRLVSFVTNTLYKESSLLAKEKGSFPAFDCEKYLQSKFVKQALTPETIQMIKQNGLRNSHLTTLAPTGNSSIYANNISGGLEPVVSDIYIRTVIVPSIPENIIIPSNVNWETKVFDCPHDKWKWIKEGDELLLRKIVDGVVYKFDRNRGLCKEEEVKDYAVMNMDDYDLTAPYAKNIFNLSVKAHIDTMKVFAKYIDSSISKTINLPADFSYDDFKNIYMDAYDSGYIKGATTYRAGTMTSVLKQKEEAVEERDSPKRPKSVHCDIHRVVVKGKKWMVFVGLNEDKPYELFAGEIGDINIPKSVTEGKLIKSKNGHYSFEYDGDILIDNITKTFDNNEHDVSTRMISLNLRHGIHIKHILDQLHKSKGTIVDFHKAITIALKKYIKDGETGGKCQECGEQLTFVEGCLVCKSCGHSKCG